MLKSCHEESSTENKGFHKIQKKKKKKTENEGGERGKPRSSHYAKQHSQKDNPSASSMQNHLAIAVNFCKLNEASRSY